MKIYILFIEIYNVHYIVFTDFNKNKTKNTLVCKYVEYYLFSFFETIIIIKN